MCRDPRRLVMALLRLATFDSHPGPQYEPPLRWTLDQSGKFAEEYHRQQLMVVSKFE